MTVRDGARYLVDAIESIRAQTWTDWELVVVDDASDDESVVIVERFAQLDRRVRLIRRHTSAGPYVAANEGLGSVRGRYVARMDADDISLPHRLASQMGFIEQHPEVRACASDAVILTGDETIPIRIHAMPRLPGAIKWAVCVRGFLQGAALIETEAFREIGGYAEAAAAQDHRLWCDLSRRHWLGALPEVVLQYRKHEGQISETRLAEQQSLHAEAVRDHILELTRERWTTDDIHALRSIGSRPLPWKHGRRLIAAFERLWQGDPRLTNAEHGELTRFTRRLRYEHRREAARQLLSVHPAGRAVLRTYTRMLAPRR